MLNLLQSETEKLQELIVPDSVQKAQLAETVHKLEKLSTLDYKQLLTDMAQEVGWILLKILLALVIYFVGKQLIKWVVRIMDKAFTRHKVEASLRSFLRSLVKALLMVMLVLAIVQTLGVNTSSFLALFASAGLAIGMALSGTLQNFAGGVILLLLRPYKVGDYIESQGQSGTVESIGLFSTCLKTPDNQTIYVPNNAIATSIIDNYSQSDTRRVDWVLSISYGDDVNVARREILAMLEADKRVLTDTAPVVYVKNLGESSVDLSIRAWVANSDYWGLYFDMNEKMYKELPSKGINFPFPQMNVNIKNNK
ncbi:MAG: mechanosensitive ion channel family protein [Alistipes sp.]|nr:mechanosensitive ion channel family protein [Alistipes sp.]